MNEMVKINGKALHFCKALFLLVVPPGHKPLYLIKSF